MLEVARAIGEHLPRYAILVTKSTVPVGTADQVRREVQKALAARAMAIEFDVVSNPEFLKEGAAIDDFMRPDRIVVGTDNPRTTELIRALYEPFTRNHDRLVVMDIRSAELTKYAANAMLATKISFMNELAAVAERVGADIEKVRIGIGSDPRIGYSFIYPGIGYGGSCFPKDVKALIRSAHRVGHDATLLRAVDSVNERQKAVLVHKLRAHFRDRLGGRTFALWGLAFKPNTDDMREAPSRVVIDALLAAGAGVRAYDPVASREAARLYANAPHADRLVFCNDAYEAALGADALLIATEWKEFRSPDYDRLKTLLLQPLIFDGRNLYDPALMQRLGFEYFAIGRGRVPQAEPRHRRRRHGESLGHARSGNSLRRRRYAAVAAVARAVSEAAAGAGRSPYHAAGHGAATDRTRSGRADGGVQRGASLPGRRTAARDRL